MSVRLWRRSTAVFVGAAGLIGALSVPAFARQSEDCQLAWGQAVRSYLTQNRNKGPEDQVFAQACDLESKGKNDEARIEAVVIGSRALAKLDPKGCKEFMESYVESAKPKDVCDAALGPDTDKLRELIKASTPARPSKGSSKPGAKKAKG